jgi:iron uptake system EfeUOB component EfeO/EfeM
MISQERQLRIDTMELITNIRRLGFDPEKIIGECLDLSNELRANETEGNLYGGTNKEAR